MKHGKAVIHGMERVFSLDGCVGFSLPRDATGVGKPRSGNGPRGPLDGSGLDSLLKRVSKSGQNRLRPADCAAEEPVCLQND